MTMKKITITFLSKKGVDVCNEIGLSGESESAQNKLIVSGAYKEKIINQNPLTIEIISKVPWLSEQIGLDKLILTLFEKKGLTQNDYIMVVQ